ncbi:GntR family transcriptional regulator [Rathayibacter sp. VKM Ac-2927]|uniref:GntR family transcriptional regulator n=1 Tax=Rathayibacter sp. VKM Ac-2927 TaxID=2929478 RepID=UPI001FB3AE7E|nr:GntR family transcriptional regulator [Rathayibacter sp. VKM Ac-2927]MCJ1688333.1 GntR family transcriptional regulator [Rathayibacter sp. VKM Ac-2927]
MLLTMANFHPRTERRLAAAMRIYDLLRSAIMHGEIPSGVLPGETELMVAFSVSRQVIRDALEQLRKEGLVQRLQGAGTLVTPTRVSHDFDVLQGPVQDIEHRIILSAEEVAPPSVARKLGLPVGANCGVVEITTFMDGVPLDTATTYVHASFLSIVEGFGAHDEWFSLYARAGIALGVTDHAIEASVADEYNASLLGVEPGHPLLVLERLVFDADGDPVEYAFTRIRGDRLTLHQRMSRQKTHPFDTPS